VITAPRPTAGLLASVLTAPWLDTTPQGDTAAFLLIAHPMSARLGAVGTVEAEMRGLAAALDLAPASERIPDVGRRLTVHGGKAVLSVTGCDYRLGADIGCGWQSFVINGGPVVVVLGLDPLAPGADRDGVEQYLGRCALACHLFTGLTRYTAPGSLR
jgi:hypothetical protein